MLLKIEILMKTLEFYNIICACDKLITFLELINIKLFPLAFFIFTMLKKAFKESQNLLC